MRSDLTVDGQRRVHLQSVREAYAEQLADNHAGGADAIAQKCTTLGLNLKQLIEESADELGEYDLDEAAGRLDRGEASSGAAPISSARGSRHEGTSEARQMSASWASLASLVQRKIQQKDPTLTISEKCVRTYCVAKYASSCQAQHHAQGKDAAQADLPPALAASPACSLTLL